MDSRHNVGTNPWNEVAVPVVPSSTHHQSIGQGTGRCVPERDSLLTVVHVDRLEEYRGMAVPAWMTAEQRGCVAV